MPRDRYTAVDSEGKPAPRQGWLSTEDAVELARGLAELTKAGVPLAGGLRALAGELPGGRRLHVFWSVMRLVRLVGLRGLIRLLDPRARREARLPRVLRKMADQLEAGAPLDAVIKAQGPRFPAHLRGLVLAGLRSGRLPEVLEEFVDVQRAQIELRRRLWLSMAYPVVLLSMVALLLIFLQLFVTPSFVRIFEDFGANLPTLTWLFIRATGPATLFLLGGLVLAAAAVLLLMAAPNAAWVPRLLYRVPLIGPLWRLGRLVQFARLMGALLGQDVPLPEALRLTAAGLRDANLAEGCRQAAVEVESGRPLAECLASRGQFPPSMIPLIDWGQRAPAMADAFRASAEMFEGQVQTRGVFLETIMLPVTFLVIALFVGLFIIAMFLPLIGIMQVLG